MEKNISRRGFLRIGGVAGITAATGGLLASCGTGGDSKKNGSLDASNREWAGEADVIVVGGGGTGFCAAVEALEAGSSVLVIDKNTVMGGNTALSGGMIQAAGHRLQKELADCSDDSPERFAKQMLGWGCGMVEEDIVTDMCKESASHVDWLMDMGRIYERCDYISPVTNFDDEETVAPRCLWDPTKPGPSHFELIHQKACSYDGLSEMTGTEIKHVILDDAGEAVGIETADGKSYKAIKGVVLSTAGLDNGTDLTKTLNPQQYWATKVYEAGIGGAYSGYDCNTGDGIRMGMEIGAGLNISTACVMTDMVGYGQPGYGAVSQGEFNVNAYNAISLAGNILVNANGRRFVQEDSHWGYVMHEIFNELQHTGALASDPTALSIYTVTSEKYANRWMSSSSNITTLEDDLASGLAYRAETLEELAEMIGVPADALVDTVARWNAFSANECDLDFGRKTDWGAIDEGPYVARHLQPVNMGSAGGLKVNSDYQVLKATDGEPIPRLYAGGMNAGGWVGPFYYSCGWAILGTVHHGRKIGKNVAALDPRQ